MIGILKPDRKILPKESKAIYSLCYCSLCKACQSAHGSSFTPFISHEITQLLIPLLKYIPCEIVKCKCHFYFNLKSCQVIKHEIFKRASDVSLILVWLKVEDAILDSEVNKYRLLHYLLKNKIANLFKSLPVKLIDEIETYKALILKSNNPENLSYLTHKIAKRLYGYIVNCVEIEEKLKEKFVEIAGLYGNIITETDFLIDYKKDKINDLKLYEKIEKHLFEILGATKEKVEELCEKKYANYYYKTSFFLSIKAINDKIERTRPNIE